MDTQAINGKAMIVQLSLSAWQGRKLDKAASRQVTDTHGAERDTARVHKDLVDSAEIKTITKIDGAIRTYHYQVTLPWDDTGSRILPTTMYFDFCQETAKLLEQRQAAIDGFLQKYNQMKLDAYRRLGTLYNPREYPDVQAIAQKFNHSIRFLPLPSAGDIRLDLPDGEVDRIRAEVQASTQAMLAGGMSDLWERLRSVVGAMVDRLGTPDAIFRDSLIGNVRELCDLLPKLNLTGDPALEAARVEVQSQLASLDPGVLRENKRERQSAAQKAQAIMDRMSGAMGVAYGEVAA